MLVPVQTETAGECTLTAAPLAGKQRKQKARNVESHQDFVTPVWTADHAPPSPGRYITALCPIREVLSFIAILKLSTYPTLSSRGQHRR
jgi:hypothetical protein